MSHNLSLLVISCLIAANSCLETCVGTKENSRLSNLRSQLKAFEQNINDLESGLKGKTLNSNPGCPKEWSRFREHCYHFSKDKKDWFEAERVCRSQGASLAAIVDKTESDWVFAKAQEKSIGVYWIGMTDVEHGKWIYSEDFSPVTKFHWNPGEPNGNTRENCMDMYKTHNGLWNDESCKLPINYVCRKHVSKGCNV